MALWLHKSSHYEVFPNTDNVCHPLFALTCPPALAHRNMFLAWRGRLHRETKRTRSYLKAQVLSAQHTFKSHLRWMRLKILCGWEREKAAGIR